MIKPCRNITKELQALYWNHGLLKPASVWSPFLLAFEHSWLFMCCGVTFFDVNRSLKKYTRSWRSRSCECLAKGNPREIPTTYPLRHFSAQGLCLPTHSASLLPVEPPEHPVLLPSWDTSGKHSLHQHQLSYFCCWHAQISLPHPNYKDIMAVFCLYYYI